jgi:hypothetical protein
MKFSNIFFCGAGGLDTILAEPIIRLVTYSQGFKPAVHIYDGDVYEDSNSSRQLFDPKYLGVNKAVALAERLSCLCKTTAYPLYVREDNFGSFVLSAALDSPYDSLIIPGVDSEAARHDIIRALDNLPTHLNYAVILPGNDYHTATCSWYTRISGKIAPCHPFDVIQNYAEPTDENRGNCGVEAVSTPQLLNANFAGALMALEIAYQLLKEGTAPLFFDYDGASWSMAKTGKLYECGTPPRIF